MLVSVVTTDSGSSVKSAPERTKEDRVYKGLSSECPPQSGPLYVKEQIWLVN